MTYDEIIEQLEITKSKIKEIARNEYGGESWNDDLDALTEALLGQRSVHRPRLPAYEHEGRQETMIIQLEIPKEFAKDYVNNRFDDFFRRVYADIDNEGMCGNYEGETAQMMARAFKESRCLDYEKTR